MKQVINNEGKSIKVTTECYNALQESCEAGVWCAITKDTDGNTHSIILPENF